MMRLPTIAILFFSREVASRHYPFRDIDNLESQDQESMSFNYDSGHPEMDFDKDYWENQDKEGRIMMEWENEEGRLMMEEQGLRKTMGEQFMSFEFQSTPTSAPVGEEQPMSFEFQATPTSAPVGEEQPMSFEFQASPTPSPVGRVVNDNSFSFVFTEGDFDDTLESIFSFSFSEEEATFSFSTGEILDEARSPVASVRGVIGIDSSELPSAESNNQLREDIAAAVGVPPDAVRIEEVLVADSSSPGNEAEVSSLRNRNRRHLSQQFVTYTWTTVFTITTTLVTTYSSCGCTNTATLAVYVTQVCSAPTFPPPCTTCNVGPVACRPKPPPPCYCCQYACHPDVPKLPPTKAPTPPPPPVINEAVALICPYPGGPEGAVSGFAKVEDTVNAQGMYQWGYAQIQHCIIEKVCVCHRSYNLNQ